MRHQVAIGLLVAVLPALAQGAPSFDCSRAASLAETLICTEPGLAALDQRLSGVYRDALAAASASEGADTLRAEQRGWIKGRDACRMAADPQGCIETAYLLREATLVARWGVQPPAATARWDCGGAPAQRIVTTFYATALPALRLEQDGQIATATQVRTASGARYEGDFGLSFWIKGDRASYRTPDPEGQTRDCVIAPAP